MMQKIVSTVQKVLGKTIAHRYTGFTIRVPFINFSFAPAPFQQPYS